MYGSTSFMDWSWNAQLHSHTIKTNTNLEKY